MLTLDLTARVAVVTGATGQLGRAMAKTLAQCGADIAVHYHHNRQKAEELCEAIRGLHRKAAPFSCDVGDLQSVMDMHKEIVKKLGAPDIVVCNAVVQYQWTTVLGQDIGDYESQFRSCVLQAVHFAKAFVPGMAEKGKGRFIAINTECAMQCLPTQSAYAAGKRGMDGVLRVLAKEVGSQGITVNEVAPGWTISERDRENGTKTDEAYSRTVPLRRRGTDQEIANTVAFLASDLASNITGAYIPVCGGNVMPCI